MTVIVNPFDGEVSENEIDVWLEQFESQERPHLVRLLQHFRYYSLRRYALLVRELPSKLAALVSGDPCEFTYASIGRIEDSGSLALYFYGQALGRRQLRTIDIEKLSEAPEAPIVLFDDYVGTGYEGVKVWNDYVRPLQRRVTVVFAAVVGTQQGGQYLEQSTGFALAIGETIDPTRALREESVLLRRDEREVVLAILEKYTKLLSAHHCYAGGHQAGTLVGFSITLR